MNSPTSNKRGLALRAPWLLIRASALFAAPVVADSLGYTDTGLRDTSKLLVADFHWPALIVDRLIYVFFAHLYFLHI